jgi:glycosyltransferase involved in cell wall biosynthesis
LIVISPRQRQDICHRFKIAPPEKVKIIPLGLELSKFTDLKPRTNDGRGDDAPHDPREILRVGIIGRLTPVKNHRMFLEAVKDVKEKAKDKYFKFVVVGDGELKDELQRYASELGVQDAVEFTGWHKDMTAVYKALDVVILTSLNEGTPVTLIEAMASGIPVVATDVGGVRDLFGRIDSGCIDGYNQAQNGILIPSERPEILAKALLYILEEREGSMKMGENAREFVVRRYSLDRLITDITSLYHELTTGSVEPLS